MLAVDRSPTRWGAALIAGLAAFSLAAWFATARPVHFLPVAAIVTAYAVWCVYRLWMPRIRRMLFHADNRVVLVPASGDENIQGTLAGTPFVSPWLVCLGVHVGGRRRSFCFFADSTDAASFRRLSAWLKNL